MRVAMRVKIPSQDCLYSMYAPKFIHIDLRVLQNQPQSIWYMRSKKHAKILAQTQVLQLCLTSEHQRNPQRIPWCTRWEITFVTTLKAKKFKIGF